MLTALQRKNTAVGARSPEHVQTLSRIKKPAHWWTMPQINMMPYPVTLYRCWATQSCSRP